MALVLTSMNVRTILLVVPTHIVQTLQEAMHALVLWVTSVMGKTASKAVVLMRGSVPRTRNVRLEPESNAPAKRVSNETKTETVSTLMSVNHPTSSVLKSLSARIQKAASFVLVFQGTTVKAVATWMSAQIKFISLGF